MAMDEQESSPGGDSPQNIPELRAGDYQDIFEHAADGWLVLRGGQCVACNAQAEVLFGRNRSGLLGRNVFSFSPARQGDGNASSALVSRYLEAAQRGLQQRFDWHFVRFDGTPFVGEVGLNRVSLGQESCLLATVRDVTARRQEERKLRESEQEFKAIIANMLDTYYQTDLDGRLTRVSPAVEGLLGFSPENIIGLHVGELYIDHNSRERFLRALREHGGELIDYEIQLRRHDRRLVWVSLNARYRRDRRGRITGVEGTVRDISERKRIEAEMRKLSTMLDQMADTVIVTDRHGVVEYVNPSFEKSTGYSREEVLGSRRWLFRSDAIDPKHYEWMWKTIGAGHVFSDLLVGRRKDGALFYEEHTITPVKDERGHITHYIATGKDVTKRMQSLGRIQYPASRDALTELPNRALFTDRLNHAVTRCKDDGGVIGVLLIDVDSFKTVNETLSKDVGDQALRALSERLARCVRDSDTVARVGGDEFAVILERLPSLDYIAPVVRKILNVLSRPFELGGRSFQMTTSIGISLFPNDGDDSATLIKNADVALYRAREQGQHSYKFYSPDISVKAFERLSLELNLRRALENDEFMAFFQPQINCSTNEVEAVEALLRWRHPDLGLVSPGDFIPILDDTDLIVPLGEWIIRQACQQAKIWQQSGYDPFTVSVNLTASQFYSPGLVELICNVLQETELAPRWLELEVQEGVLAQHEKDAVRLCAKLGDLGVGVAVDDFGTGLTSLANLQRFQIRKVKIDRTFVGDAIKDPADAAIVKAIVAVSKAFGMRAVAEGVESEEQRDFLMDQGCELMQGFLFTPPRAAPELQRLLRRRPG